MPNTLPGIGNSEMPNQSFAWFKGLQCFSLIAILLWIFSLAFLAMIVQSIIVGSWPGAGIYFFFLLFWLLFLGRRLFYFGLSDEYLAVRLHNFFWIKRIFRLSDIKEIVVEKHYSMPPSLRIIGEGFESKAYPAASLWPKHWRHLLEKLGEKNIKVSNEEAAYRPGIFTTIGQMDFFR